VELRLTGNSYLRLPGRLQVDLKGSVQIYEESTT